MVPDRHMDECVKFYHELHAKIMHMYDVRLEFLQRYPDASCEVGERAMCLMSDIIDMKTYEAQVNIIYDADALSPCLTMSVWRRDDRDGMKPLFMYMEDCPGSSRQGIPKLMRNKKRKNTSAACADALPSNGFIMSRSPKMSQETFTVDTFDSDVRRPLVTMIEHMRSAGYDVSEMHVEVMEGVPDTSAGDDAPSPNAEDPSGYLHELD